MNGYAPLREKQKSLTSLGPCPPIKPRSVIALIRPSRNGQAYPAIATPNTHRKGNSPNTPQCTLSYRLTLGLKDDPNSPQAGERLMHIVVHPLELDEQLVGVVGASTAVVRVPEVQVVAVRLGLIG